MNTEIVVHAYVHDLEKHLQLTLFGGQVADPEGAVLLVRGALAGGDPGRAAALADATRRLAAATPDHPNMAAAADHARGLIHQDGALLEQVVGRYTTARARATALEDAGSARAGQGSQDSAEALSNRQVASRVFLSSHTVAFHLRHVFWKLGVTSRVQLARMAAGQAA